MDIDDIRRANITTLEQEFGGIAALANATGMSYTQCRNYRDGVPDSKTGKIRGMRKETAAKFERAGGKPPGWLDQLHSEVAISSDGADASTSAKSGRRISSEASMSKLAVVSQLVPRNDSFYIPQYAAAGAMGAGLVLPDQPGVIHNWQVNREWLDKNARGHSGVKNLCIVTGFGDSMRPMFNPGDPLLVDQGIKTVSADGVYFFRIRDEGFIKRLQRIPTATGMNYRAKSENSKNYDDWSITEDMDFEVLGKVIRVWCGTDF